MHLALVYVTYPNEKSANNAITALLKKKLIACANMVSAKSAYIEKNKIKKSKEVIGILKTQKANFEKLKMEIEKTHPYKTPCILLLDADANHKFFNWVLESTINSQQ